jgi:hypothetical protein
MPFENAFTKRRHITRATQNYDNGLNQRQARILLKQMNNLLPEEAEEVRTSVISRRHWSGLPMAEPVEGTLADVMGRLPHFGRQPFTMPSVNGDEVGVNRYVDMVYRMGTRQGEKPIPVGIVSKNYRLVDHQQLLSTIEQGLTANNIDIEKVRVIGHWTVHGERAHLSFLFPKEERFLHQVDDDKDKMRFRIEVFNSVDGSSRLMVVASWLRLVCSNGLVVTAMMDLRRQHRQQLQIEEVGRLLQQAIRDAENDKVIFAHWESQRISHHALTSWVDTDVSQKWGVKAAVRVLGIARTGYDIAVTGDLKRPPSEFDMKRRAAVPGIRGPVENVFGITQVLSWVAGQRGETAENCRR